MTDRDLKHALKLATSERPAPEPADDLARALTARTTRTRRRVRIGLSSLAMTAVVGVGTTIAVTGSDVPAEPAAGNSATSSANARDASGGVQLVAATFNASPYTFDLTPQGWSVQGQNASLVTIAPDGSTTGYRDDFEGKLVIMFEARPPGGREVTRDGRKFWITGDSGYTTISTWTRADEPDGAVRLQYPNNTGWTEDTMLAFTASVHVGDGANYGGGGQEEYPVPDGAQRPNVPPTTGNAGN